MKNQLFEQCIVAELRSFHIVVIMIVARINCFSTSIPYISVNVNYNRNMLLSITTSKVLNNCVFHCEDGATSHVKYFKREGKKKFNLGEHLSSSVIDVMLSKCEVHQIGIGCH